MSAKTDNTMRKPRVGLFVTCLVDLVRPNVGFAAVKLLEQAGCEVHVPDTQTCCGQPAFNSGADEHAAALARAVIAAFEKFDYVVVPSGSCAGMLRVHYPECLKNDQAYGARARALAAKTYELVSFLVDVRKLKSVDTSCEARATYHDSCSCLREMKVMDQPRDILKSVEGFDLKDINGAEICCGFGGLFSVKYPEISERMADDKLAAVGNAGADMLVGADLGCLLHLAGRAHRTGKPLAVRHVAEVLAGITDIAALGRTDAKDGSS